MVWLLVNRDEGDTRGEGCSGGDSKGSRSPAGGLVLAAWGRFRVSYGLLCVKDGLGWRCGRGLGTVGAKHDHQTQQKTNFRYKPPAI